MPNLQALLIGINEYAPGSGMRNLSGCANDVKATQAFWKKLEKALRESPVKDPHISKSKLLAKGRKTLSIISEGDQIKAEDQLLLLVVQKHIKL
jgi:hypothetical protein